MSYFELVNFSTGNRIGEFDTEAEALRDVQNVKQRRGDNALAAIALTWTDDQGNTSIVAEGQELAQLAERTPVSA
jgi:hypothetical protein